MTAILENLKKRFGNKETGTMKNEVTKAEKQEAVRMEYHDFRPAADIIEHKDGFRMLLDMPGVDKEHLSVEIDEGTLSISGVSGIKHGGKTIRYGRQYELSDDIDGTKVKATIKDGVLTLELPKSDAAKVHKITVAAG